MMTRKATPPNGNRWATLVLICFFFSGMTALIYEIIWMRMISRVIGGAPFAVSTILVIFMGGMGIGSFLAARKIDRIEEVQLIRLYGALELLIGIYALCVPILLMVFRGVVAMVYNAFFSQSVAYNIFIFGGALLLLILPAVCMGATLPILCRFYVGRLSHLGTHAGRLYGLNTLGAAVGSVLCGFWLIEWLGVWGTMLSAVGINVAIGLVCLRLAPPPGAPRRQKAVPTSQTHDGPVAQPPDTRGIATAALLIFLISGFCAMAYEVFWTKLLGLIVGPTTYSFTIVLVSFIIGLALGNLIFGRLTDRSRDPLGLLIATQIAAALLALAVSQVLGNSQLFFAKVIFTFRNNFALLAIIKGAAVFCFLMPPTFFLGATFPLVAKIYTPSLASVGRAIGRAYAVNTLGAVLGSFCAGFVLIPLVGKENGLRLVIALQIATALVVAGVVFTRQRAGFLRWAALTGVLAAGALLCSVYPAWNRHLLATGKYHRFEETPFVEDTLRHTGWAAALFQGAPILAATERGKLIYYGDGIGGFTTVLEYPGPFGEPEISMANSGKMDASTRGDMKTQTLLAQFPMLFAKAPKNVMVLGLASGVTAGEVLHYPIDQLDVVDINDRVIEAAQLFSAWNNNVLAHPKTRLILQDGMAHLALTDTRYDVIISEPSNPWMAGMAALFTRDFFETASGALSAQGIYVQWFHCYQMNWDTFALIGRSFAEVFPHSMLVSAEPGGWGKDYLFVGFKDKAGLNWDTARANLPFARQSSNIDLAYPELFYPLIISENLRALFGPGPINTEDRPLLEYAAPKLMYQGAAAQQILVGRLAERSRISAALQEGTRQIRQSVDAQIDFAAYALSVHAPFMNMVDLSTAPPAQKKRYTALLEGYCRANPIDFELIQDPALVRHLRDIQIAAIASKMPTMQSNVSAHLYLAQLYADNGRSQDAIDSYQHALRLTPEDAVTHNNLGFELSRIGNMAAALQHYKAALRINPNFVLALGNMAFSNLQMNRPDEALHYFQETLRVQPGIAEAHYNIGHICYQKGLFAEAVSHLRQAVRIEHDMVEALNTLAWILATSQDRTTRDPKGAIAYAQRACTLTGEKEPELLATLAVAYAAADHSEASQRTAELALKIARDNGREDVVQLIEKHIRMF